MVRDVLGKFPLVELMENYDSDFSLVQIVIFSDNLLKIMSIILECVFLLHA